MTTAPPTPTPVGEFASFDDGLALTPGAKFRGLTIQSLLGKGGMGSAFLASHPILRVPLVIKTFRPMDEGDIFKEAHLAARVSSPHTIAVVDAGFEKGIPFLVQQHVDGIDLGELTRWLMQCRMDAPVGVVARIIAQAAAGLHAVHQAGVVHCDVKPPNLFLRGDGSVTVGDFGIAIPTVAERGFSYAGSPYFAAPEQWRDTPLDRRCDIYGLGATTHFLKRKEPPFPGPEVDKIREAHLYHPYQPPQTSDPVEAFLYLMIETMMQKEPNARPSTAAIVARNLQGHQQEPPSYIMESEHCHRIGNVRVTLNVADLPQTKADVIVNAASRSLSMRKGVANALREAGGDEIETHAKRQGPIGLGDVVWTRSGKLRAKEVAHAAAAAKGAGCIQRCVLRTLFGAERRGHRTIAFPALGTGVAELPAERAAQLTLEAIRTFAEFQPRKLTSIEIVVNNLEVYRSWMDIAESI